MSSVSGEAPKAPPPQVDTKKLEPSTAQGITAHIMGRDSEGRTVKQLTPKEFKREVDLFLASNNYKNAVEDVQRQAADLIRTDLNTRTTILNERIGKNSGSSSNASEIRSPFQKIIGKIAHSCSFFFNLGKTNLTLLEETGVLLDAAQKIRLEANNLGDKGYSKQINSQVEKLKNSYVKEMENYSKRSALKTQREVVRNNKDEMITKAKEAEGTLPKTQVDEMWAQKAQLETEFENLTSQINQIEKSAFEELEEIKEFIDRSLESLKPVLQNLQRLDPQHPTAKVLQSNIQQLETLKSQISSETVNASLQNADWEQLQKNMDSYGNWPLTINQENRLQLDSKFESLRSEKLNQALQTNPPDWKLLGKILACPRALDPKVEQNICLKLCEELNMVEGEKNKFFSLLHQIQDRDLQAWLSEHLQKDLDKDAILQSLESEQKLLNSLWGAPNTDNPIEAFLAIRNHGKWVGDPPISQEAAKHLDKALYKAANQSLESLIKNKEWDKVSQMLEVGFPLSEGNYVSLKKHLAPLYGYSLSQVSTRLDEVIGPYGSSQHMKKLLDLDFSKCIVSKRGDCISLNSVYVTEFDMLNDILKKFIFQAPKGGFEKMAEQMAGKFSMKKFPILLTTFRAHPTNLSPKEAEKTATNFRNYNMTQAKGSQATRTDAFFTAKSDDGSMMMVIGSGYQMQKDRDRTNETTTVFNRKGDPIADDIQARKFQTDDGGELIIFSSADGSGHGNGALKAAQSANTGFIKGCEKALKESPVKNSQDMVKVGIRALGSAQHEILLEETKDTVHAGIIIKKNSFGHANGVISTVGDMKVFVRRNDGKIEELTRGNRGQVTNLMEPGGQLAGRGAGVPDLRNLTVVAFEAEPGDVILPMSDGIHDNLDPEYVGGVDTPAKALEILQNSSHLSSSDKDLLTKINSSTLPAQWGQEHKDIAILKEVFLVHKVAEIDANKDSNTSLAEALANHARETASHFNSDPNAVGSYGKPDHISCGMIKI